MPEALRRPMTPEGQTSRQVETRPMSRENRAATRRQGGDNAGGMAPTDDAVAVRFAASERSWPDLTRGLRFAASERP